MFIYCIYYSYIGHTYVVKLTAPAYDLEQVWADSLHSEF